MSVIAWDGKFIAADKQASRAGTCRATTKLIPYSQYILAFSGIEQTGLILANWYRDGCSKAEFPKSQMNGDGKEGDYWSELLVVSQNKPLYFTLWPVPVVVQESFFAMGNGLDLALGAMAAGADAIEAVEIAIRFNDSCGMGIDAYDLETMSKVR